MSVLKWHLLTVPSLQSPYVDEDGLYSENDASKVATMLGVRLVGQVLEEACTVVSATQRIGWPWTSVLSIFKDLKAGKVTVPERDALFEYLQGDNELVNETREHVNVVATSTPNKGETMMKLENSLIGQGDEEIDTSHNERNQSLTMYINQLFDMSVVSEVDKEEIEMTKTDVTIQDDYKLSGIICEIIENIFQRVVNMTAENQANIIEIPLEEDNILETTETDEEDIKEKIRDIHYAFIQEAYDTCGLETVKCFLDQDDDISMDDYEQITNATVDVHRDSEQYVEHAEPIIRAKSDEDEKEEKCKTARYENAYLSLNRDYEQCSDDGDPVLQDPKEPMQEVKLFPSSDDCSSSACQEEEARTIGSVRGVCPLSPEARCRAASMLDQRELYSPPANRCGASAWKFNTINEGIVQSTRWKDYTYELAEKSSDEFC